LVTCLLIVAAWTLSYRWTAGYVGASWDCLLAGGTAVYHSGMSWSGTGWATGDVPARMFGDTPLIRFVARRPGGMTVCFPLWLLLAVFGVPTTVSWCRAWREDCRMSPGHCQNCGYDLRGNVSGRCPECRTAIDTPSESARE
jgi:hypothetical protein